MLGEVENVPHLGRAEGIDALRIVTNDGEPFAVWLERQQDACLEPVRILVLVDQDVIEAASDLFCQLRYRHCLSDVEQQIVVVQAVVALLRFDVGLKQPLQLRLPIQAPWKRDLQHLVQGQLRIDGARVDREARGLGRKPALLGSRGRVRDEPGSSGPRRLRDRGSRSPDPGRSDSCTRAAAARRSRGRCRPIRAWRPMRPFRCFARIRSTRRFISSAARRENVSIRIRLGSTALSHEIGNAVGKVLVFPLPAPAITSSGAEALPPRG